MVRQRYGSLYRAYRFSLAEVDAVAAIWNYIKDVSIERPVKSDKILEKLACAAFNQTPVRLFSPWGPRYKNPSPRIQESDPEVNTLLEMKAVVDEFQSRGVKTNILIMPADVYGTEINGLPADFVYSYFSYLEDMARGKLGNVDIKSWSSIRRENWEMYEKVTLNPDESLERELERVFDKEFEKAGVVARRFNPSNAMTSAKRYIVERLAEAMIIDSVYSPVKLSLVRKEKDSLDGPLPRVYLVKNRAPWMAGE